MITIRGYTSLVQIHDTPGSQVLRAKRDVDGVPVILKVLKPSNPSAERLAWFKQEFDRLERLSGPGIIVAHDLICDQQTWVIVQEDAGGDSLARYMATTKRELSELITIAIGIVEALGRVHQAHIIHKDINPSNIVYNQQKKEVKLIDFGISTALSRQNQTITNPEVLEGTFPYLSPEQTGRMNRAIDYRTDFYSLGVTFYELFTGSLPFTTRDPVELVHCHIAMHPVPPHEQNPAVPRAISSIILKLMSKTAESRYQSTYGIKADLLACQTSLREQGKVGEIELGKFDISERFQIPQRLYGREREVEALMSAFERVVGRGNEGSRSEFVLIAGPSGIGKSAIVQELYRPITGRRGYFIAGKFDQFHGGAPYSAFARAFHGLIQQILSESETRLQAVRDELMKALGGNAALIIDILPEVAHIIGPQPPAQPLGPTEAQNRFRRAFLSFIRVFARPQHPLILFLDDLQRSDAGSLRLIEMLMQDQDLTHFLFVGAYRDAEVSAAHPLSSTLETLINADVFINRMHLGPLQLNHVTDFVAATVNANPAEVESLASLVLRKTDGNPLFVGEFLKEVHHEGLIEFDAAIGRWTWDVARIEAKGMTDNVVDLMIDKLRRLPDATCHALRLAACLGSTFDLTMLARVCQLEPASGATPEGEAIAPQHVAATFELLMPALDGGFLIASSALAAISADSPLVVRDFKFMHDRVQQAAYALIAENDRRALHLRIARLLTATISPEEREARLFALVDHWNLAGDLVVEVSERIALAELNLAAGRRARASLAYGAARSYLAAAVKVLGQDGLESRRDIALPLFRELTEAEYLVGNHDRAEELAQKTIALAPTVIEQADVYAMVVSQYTMRAKYDDAVATARKGLALLGVDLPETNWEPAMYAELGLVNESMQGRDVSALLDRPEMADPWSKVATRLLLRAFAAAFYLSPILYSLIIFKAINFSLKYGHPPEGSDLYSYYGHLLSGVLGQHRPGYEFGLLSLRLSERTGRHDDACRASFIVANFIHPWVHPLNKALPINDGGYQSGLASGELQFGGYILVYKLMNQFYEGKPIAQILETLPAFLDFNKKANNQIAVDIIRGIELILTNLTNEEEEVQVGTLTEADYLANCEAHKSLMAIVYYQILKTQVLYLRRDIPGALQAAKAAEQLLPVIMGNIAVAEHCFYSALSLAASCPAEPGESRDATLAKLNEAAEKLRKFATDNYSNFGHMRFLVEAELARIEAKAEAQDLYDQAIDAAHENGFPQDEALAHELCSRYWNARKKDRIARTYVSEAYRGYQRWGCAIKLKVLTHKFPWLALSDTGMTSLTSSVTSVTRSSQRLNTTLDLMSVVKASQAISSEIVLDKLFSKLMQIILENAGAERGVLILEERGELVVNVDAAVNPMASQPALPTVTSVKPTPYMHYDALAKGVVRYVARTRRSVILSDATKDGDFTQDPYILEFKPKSVLCAPIVGRGQLIAILYAENNLATGAFTNERLDVLKHLSAQIAISLENGRLYNDMERKVEERTEDLRKKNIDLQSALMHLKETQQQLVEQAKMASLGQLTAGIAHEIKNPLNFVNNFAELNVELANEMYEELRANPKMRMIEAKDSLKMVRMNSEKIVEHGKRADGIVRSMMQHASGGTGERRRVLVNSIVEEYLNLAYHGMKAQDKSADIAIVRDLGENAGHLEIFPQEIGRVLVNLLNNAFYAVRDRQKAEPTGYAPMVKVSTRRHANEVTIAIEDNGLGVPQKVKDMIFMPFFTTKPTGQGTGLGLSMSYDIIVQGHRGRLRLEDGEDKGARFIIALPC